MSMSLRAAPNIAGTATGAKHRQVPHHRSNTLMTYIQNNDMAFMEALISSQHQGIRKRMNKQLLEAFKNIKITLFAMVLKNSELQGELNILKQQPAVASSTPTIQRKPVPPPTTPPENRPARTNAVVIQMKASNMTTNSAANFIQRSYYPAELGLKDVEMKVTTAKVIITSTNADAIHRLKTAIASNQRTHELTTHEPTPSYRTYMIGLYWTTKTREIMNTLKPHCYRDNTNEKNASHRTAHTEY